MSEQSGGAGWWMASDGRWYPPEAHPDRQRPPSPPSVGFDVSGAPGFTVPGGDQRASPRSPSDASRTAPIPQAPAQPQPQPGFGPHPGFPASAHMVSADKQRRGWLAWIVAGVGVLVALGAIAAVAVSGDESPQTIGADDDATGRDAVAEVGGSSDEVDDVNSCELVDDQTLVLDITNNSSEQSNYLIDVNFLDANGNRVGDEPFFINYLRSGERTVEESFIVDSADGVSCEIAEVDRFSAESADEVDEVTCRVVGLDFADDIEAEFTATNGSSALSDYFITAALVRDGVRIGTSFASIDNVRPGESAPGDGFSVVDGPVDGVSCEVVDVSRFES